MFSLNRIVSLALTAGFALGVHATPMTQMKVNGEIISAATQEAMVAALLKQGLTRSEQLEERVRYVLSRDVVLSQLAKRAKINKDKNVQREIEAATRQILIRAYIKNYITKHPVKEPEVRALYDRQKANWGPIEVKVRHILLKDETFAKTILERVKTGEDFAKLAKEHSLDTEQNKNAGGVIDWTSPIVLGTELATALSALDPGEFAPAPVKSRFGWHVLKLDGRRESKRWMSYEDNKAALTNLLVNKKIQTFVQDQIKRAKVEIVQPNKAPAKQGR